MILRQDWKHMDYPELAQMLKESDFGQPPDTSVRVMTRDSPKAVPDELQDRDLSQDSEEHFILLCLGLSKDKPIH